MEKAFSYIRVSSRQQAKDTKDGFPRQERAIKEYAHLNHLQLIQTYREPFTGTEEDRPVLAELLVSLEKNGHGIKTVIIEKLDRLARDLMVQEAIVRDFQQHGFRLISVEEGPDLLDNTPTRKFIRQVLGAVAEFDKSMLVAKLRVARERKRKAGGKADGRNSYRQTEEGRRIVQRLRELARKPKEGRRRTLQQIADTMNAEGMLTMDKKEWSLYRVAAVLKPAVRSRKTRKL